MRICIIIRNIHICRSIIRSTPAYIYVCLYAICLGSLVGGDMCTLGATECVFELYATSDIKVRIMIVIV